MMNAAPVFDRAYGGLKTMLRQGALPPGTRLDPAALSEILVASVTPVRDALHRLVGERMVDATSEGFQVPLLSEPDLRDLYVWNQQLLLLALRLSVRVRADFLDGAPIDDTPETIERLFAAIAKASENRELGRAIDGLNDRLHATRQAERAGLPEGTRELEEMAAADLRTLRTLLGRYHRRRIAAAPDIIRALYRAPR